MADRFRTKLHNMAKANPKRSGTLLLILTAALLFGCESREERRAAELQEAAAASESGDYGAALVILESLNEAYPNDTAILRRIGETYLSSGDLTSAAFFLEQAYATNPGDADLLLKTITAKQAAGFPLTDLLKELDTVDSSLMSPPLRLELAKALGEEGATEASLSAYLKATQDDPALVGPDSANEIGQQFLALGNQVQAERWFGIAAEGSGDNAREALFGLLEIRLSAKDWSGAETLIKRLDKEHPGSLDESDWAYVRTELEEWRAAQAKLAAELKKREEAEQKAEEATEAAETSSGGTSTEGKAAVIADMDLAAAMADAPAIEAPEEAVATDEAPAEIERPTIIYNPDIAVEPAEPETSLSVTFDQAGSTPSVDVRFEDAPAQTITPDPTETTTATGITTETADIDTLIARASKATLDRNFAEAIRLYWSAINKDNSRAEIWSDLSKVYILEGQSKNAETAALEAVRLQPREINYTLDYLRIAQRSKPADDFIAELQTAYDRFPRSPEIALSLARANERIAEDLVAARLFYQRFIELAPDHPLRPEAEGALARLR